MSPTSLKAIAKARHVAPVAGALAAAFTAACAVGGSIFALRNRDFHWLAGAADQPAFVQTTTNAQGQRLRVLNVKGAWESATFLDERRFELALEYYRAFDVMFGFDIPIHRACMLGAGGCSYPKYAVTHFPNLHMDAVELDPAIADAAKRYFFVDELLAETASAPQQSPLASNSSLALIVADARAHLQECRSNGTRYDAILNDAFAGSCPVAALATQDALSLAKDALNPGGLYLANVSSTAQGQDTTFLLEFQETLETVFDHVLVFPCADEDLGDEGNFMLVAFDDHESFDCLK